MVKLYFVSDEEKELYDKLFEEVIAEKRTDLTNELRLDLFERTITADKKRKLIGLILDAFNKEGNYASKTSTYFIRYNPFFNKQYSDFLDTQETLIHSQWLSSAPDVDIMLYDTLTKNVILIEVAPDLYSEEKIEKAYSKIKNINELYFNSEDNRKLTEETVKKLSSQINNNPIQGCEVVILTKNIDQKVFWEYFKNEQIILWKGTYVNEMEGYVELLSSEKNVRKHTNREINDLLIKGEESDKIINRSDWVEFYPSISEDLLSIYLMLEIFTRLTSEPFNFEDIKPIIKDNLVNFTKEELKVLYEKIVKYSLKTGVIKTSSDEELENYQLFQPDEDNLITKFYQVYIQARTNVELAESNIIHKTIQQNVQERLSKLSDELKEEAFNLIIGKRLQEQITLDPFLED
ncbi:MAG: hypothetical protein ACTSYA_08465 [Candidatus Kariarchaeaceae archaeon]